MSKTVGRAHVAAPFAHGAVRAAIHAYFVAWGDFIQHAYRVLTKTDAKSALSIEIIFAFAGAAWPREHLNRLRPKGKGVGLSEAWPVGAGPGLGPSAWASAHMKPTHRAIGVTAVCRYHGPRYAGAARGYRCSFWTAIACYAETTYKFPNGRYIIPTH